MRRSNGRSPTTGTKGDRSLETVKGYEVPQMCRAWQILPEWEGKPGTRKSCRNRSSGEAGTSASSRIAINPQGALRCAFETLMTRLRIQMSVTLLRRSAHGPLHHTGPLRGMWARLLRLRTSARVRELQAGTAGLRRTSARSSKLVRKKGRRAVCGPRARTRSSRPIGPLERRRLPAVQTPVIGVTIKPNEVLPLEGLSEGSRRLSIAPEWNTSEAMVGCPLSGFVIPLSCADGCSLRI